MVAWDKTLVLGKTEGRRRRERERTKGLDGIIDSMSLSKLWVMVNDREARLQSMELQRVECD